MTKAILMAAGLGTRMRPLTETMPKPMIPVCGTPMIETVVKGLLANGVDELYVVVGYLKEKFAPLAEKYPEIRIVENTEYTIKNNISSIHAVTDYMHGDDFFICEADLYVSDPSIFAIRNTQSCYYGVMVEGHSDDWVFDQDENGRITRVGKYGDDVYNMCGVSWFTQKDIETLRDCILKAYESEGHEQLFWDEVVDQNLDILNLTVCPIERKQIIELDTADELCAFEAKLKNEA